MQRILRSNGVLYLSVKQGADEILQEDARYGGLSKFWSYFEEMELKKFVEESGFKVEKIEVLTKGSDYQTHPIICLFASS